MKNFLKNVPLPFSPLMLSFASLGNRFKEYPVVHGFFSANGRFYFCQFICNVSHGHDGILHLYKNFFWRFRCYSLGAGACFSYFYCTLRAVCFHHAH